MLEPHVIYYYTHVSIYYYYCSLKVRIQTATGPNTGILQSIREFGGVASLFRGMAAPLGAAAVINAIIFGSYGFSSRLYDDQISATNTFADDNNNDDDDDASGLPTHDPWQKAIACGSFAGLVQCFIICPMEHVKCRLQTQGTSSATTKNMHKYIGPLQATRHIVAHHGVQRLYQGWWSTVAREVPAFGLYFAIYDHLKDRTLTLLRDRERCLLAANGTVTSTVPNETTNTNSNKSLSNKNSAHAWMASAIAGGCSGSLTWAVVYPVDLIKSKIQTAPLTTPFRQLSMWNVGRSIYQQHGWRFFFRGLGITVVRAFPVNGTIFPVYEFTLQQMSGLGY